MHSKESRFTSTYQHLSMEHKNMTVQVPLYDRRFMIFCLSLTVGPLVAN